MFEDWTGEQVAILFLIIGQIVTSILGLMCFLGTREHFRIHTMNSVEFTNAVNAILVEMQVKPRLLINGKYEQPSFVLGDDEDVLGPSVCHRKRL